MAESKGGGGRMCGTPVSHGTIWFIGWLFTIGYLHLHFWKGALALIIWPYFLGMALGGK